MDVYYTSCIHSITCTAKVKLDIILQLIIGQIEPIIASYCESVTVHIEGSNSYECLHVRTFTNLKNTRVDMMTSPTVS